ncbi:amidohydrolase [Bremerella sp. T1]|uniref:amidohydrolase n=1 Tax=Bremerella sp. TYQ1 TaxID=3119568 RepID=UPI001CCBD79E|nr:amidohydrolase [Bremerella volcania]UBM38818.1 amidohydrolase [Bremerella volcania]
MSDAALTPQQQMDAIDLQMAHLWMVRTFLKHAEETEEDDELQEVARTLYDYMLALGPAVQAGDPAAYMKQAKKKFSKLRKACELFEEIQPEISDHTNFQMAAISCRQVVNNVEAVLGASTNA